MNLNHESRELSLGETFLPALTFLIVQPLLPLLLVQEPLPLVQEPLLLLKPLLLQVILLLPALLLELLALLVQQALLLVLVVVLISCLASQAPKSSLSLITPTMAVFFPFSKLMASTTPAPPLPMRSKQPALLLKTVSNKSQLVHRC